MASGDIFEVDTGAPAALPQQTLSSIFIPDPEDEIMPLRFLRGLRERTML